MAEEKQRTEKWFKDRLGKATSSCFADVMAVLKSGGEAATRRNYRAQLVVERLTGVVQEMYQNGAMQWGTDTEPLAAVAYSMATGQDVEETEFVAHKTLQAGASPDRLVGKDGLVEIKCPNTATHIDTLKAGKAPSQYITQMQGQMWITGRLWCDFVSFDPRMPEGSQLFISRVMRDDEFIKKLEAGVIQFLKEVDEEVKFVKAYKLKV